MGIKKRPAPYTLRFADCIEVRMGSPFNLCRAILRGKGVPQLPNKGDDYQDLKAWSSDGQTLALVRWRSEGGNVPVFSLVVVSLSESRVEESEPIAGCCLRIAWDDALLRYETAEGQRGVFSA